MIRKREIEIKWHAVGKAFLQLDVAFGAGFFILALLNRVNGYKPLAENSP